MTRVLIMALAAVLNLCSAHQPDPDQYDGFIYKIERIR